MRFGASVRRALCWMTLITLLSVAPCTFAAENAAEELTDTSAISVAVPLSRKAAEKLGDGLRVTHARLFGPFGATVRLPQDTPAQMLYVEWYDTPKRVTLAEFDDAGHLLRRQQHTDNTLDCGYPLLPGTARVRISGGWMLDIANIHVVGEGTLPAFARAWTRALDRCDLLVVSAHCDDELLFMGGAIPYYAGELGYAVLVAYMAHGERMRQGEALDGLWTCNVQNEPVFMGFPDQFFDGVGEAEAAWGRDTVLTALVRLLRRTRPLVVLTHGLAGEYGHGAHLITSNCMLEAVELAADPAFDAASAKECGAWQVKKLYLHNGSGDTAIRMDWNKPLAAFNGKTAIEVADEAYQKHVSQLYLYSNVYNPGLYNDSFGLYFSTVGPDVAKNDFFEHIPRAELTLVP